MNSIKEILSGMTAAVIFILMAVNFNACSEQSPLASESSRAGAALAKVNRRAPSGDAVLYSNTVEEGSMTARYSNKWNAYHGGKIMLSQGSQFYLYYGSLTPPAELQGQNVTISMRASEDPVHHETVFEFGPHGSEFNPPAEVYLHYNGSNPRLFYIREDGSRVQQQPDEVDVYNQWIVLKVNHFSRYAVAWSN